MIRSTRGRSVSVAERRWLKVFRTLNEFQARLFAADKALDLGRGGITRLSVLTGLSRTTITKAVEELESGRNLVSGEGRIRRVGGGRKKIEGVDPGVRDLLTKILEETTAGDPMSQLRWTSKSTRTLAQLSHLEGLSAAKSFRISEDYPRVFTTKRLRPIVT